MYVVVEKVDDIVEHFDGAFLHNGRIHLGGCSKEGLGGKEGFYKMKGGMSTAGRGIVDMPSFLQGFYGDSNWKTGRVRYRSGSAQKRLNFILLQQL